MRKIIEEVRRQAEIIRLRDMGFVCGGKCEGWKHYRCDRIENHKAGKHPAKYGYWWCELCIKDWRGGEYNGKI